MLGLSISKQFIPSVANTVGTNMQTYKIIKKGQFACSIMQVRRDGKMPLALLQEVDEAIISQAYPVFEIKNEQELLPEYLMMWFSRLEFDREACFHAVGGVRGSLEWEDFENMQLPIPHIDKQREIVKEYNVIQNRINLNEQLNQKLEEMVQTIYREWFVEGADEKWETVKLGELIKGNPETVSSKDNFRSILYLDTSNITNNKIAEIQNLKLDTDEIPSRAKRKVKNNDIIFSTVRPALKHFGILKNPPENFIVSTGFAVIRLKDNSVFPELVYSFLINENVLKVLQAKAEMSVSTYPSITIDDIFNLDFTMPDNETLEKARKFFKTQNHFINFRNQENQKLTELKELLLSKLATIEN